MENGSLKIQNILGVHKGHMKEGFLKRRHLPRHSDAFVYFISGKIEYIFESYTFTTGAGEMIYLAKNATYDMNILQEAETVWIDFEFESAAKTRQSLRFKSIANSVGNLFESFFLTYHKPALGKMAQMYSILYELYAQGARAFYKPYQRNDSKLSEITEYVLKNYTDPHFSVLDIARYAKITETHLRRIFQTHFSVSPTKYITLLRIEKAKALLEFSNISIKECAFLCGFTDQYYFSRAFKKELGLSPTEYLKSKKLH